MRWQRTSLPCVQPSAVESEASRKATAQTRSLTKGACCLLDDERSWPRHGQRLIVLKLASRLSATPRLRRFLAWGGKSRLRQQNKSPLLDMNARARSIYNRPHRTHSKSDSRGTLFKPATASHGNGKEPLLPSGPLRATGSIRV